MAPCAFVRLSRPSALASANRSALAWLADRLRVKTDARSGITHDPNTAFQGDEIAALVRRVTTVAVETVRIVEALPALGLPEA